MPGECAEVAVEHNHYEEVRRLEEHAYFEQQRHQVAEELYHQQVGWQRQQVQAPVPPAAAVSPTPDVSPGQAWAEAARFEQDQQRVARQHEWEQALERCGTRGWVRADQVSVQPHPSERPQWSPQPSEQVRQAPAPRPDDEVSRQRQWVAARRRQLRSATRSAEPEDTGPVDEPDLPALPGSDEPEHAAAELGLRYS